MPIVALVMLGILTLAMGGCVYMLVRNQAVYNYRTKVSKVVFSASAWDYKWRVKEMDAVSYNDMMLKWWKWPLSDFYPDKSFLDLTQVREIAPEAFRTYGTQKGNALLN
jgi:hypothetical protein